MNIKKAPYRHFGESLFVDNGIVQAVMPLNLGIRIIGFSFSDGENVFYEQPDDMVNEMTNESGWRIFGGARLWASPESSANYYPDSEPISYEIKDNTVILKQRFDPFTGFEKSVKLTFGENEAAVYPEYFIKNSGEKPAQIALWALTVMRAGGKQTVKLPLINSDPFTPMQTYRLWEYTDLSDPRVKISRDTFEIDHFDLDRNFKIGFINYYGHVEYENSGITFARDFDGYDASLKYSDGGVNYETYMCRHMNELEVLSPLYTVAPGEEISMKEKWSLSRA